MKPKTIKTSDRPRTPTFPTDFNLESFEREVTGPAEARGNATYDPFLADALAESAALKDLQNRHLPEEERKVAIRRARVQRIASMAKLCEDNPREWAMLLDFIVEQARASGDQVHAVPDDADPVRYFGFQKKCAGAASALFALERALRPESLRQKAAAR
jgi:hypothetical protein